MTLVYQNAMVYKVLIGSCRISSAAEMLASGFGIPSAKMFAADLHTVMSMHDCHEHARSNIYIYIYV